jgi:hypothetical protein
LRRLRALFAIALLATVEAGCDHGPKVGPPQQVTRIGDDQSADAGAALPNPPNVVVVDANAHGVPGVTVNFVVTSGGGSVQNATATTDKTGTASAGVWTLGTVAGPQSLTASASEIPGFPVKFTALATAGPTESLTKVGAEPVASAAGGNIDSIVVLAADQFGNPVANQAVTFSVTAGGGSVSPPSRLTLADGRAATRWTLGPEIGISNTATAARPDGSLSVTFATTSTRPVAQVRFAEHVIVVDSGSSLTPAISLVDASGNPVPGATATLVVRNVGVASAGTSITGTRSGQTFAVATSFDNSSAKDSAVLIVSGAGKPAVLLSVPRFDLKADTTFTVSLIIDSRSASTPVGSATLQVVWNTSVLAFVGEQAVAGSALVDVNSSATANGVLTVGMASSSGVTGPTEIRRITFKASAVANQTGLISVDVADIASAGTFVNLTGQTVSGSYPVRIR